MLLRRNGKNRFHLRDENGSFSVEAVLIIPLLLLIMVFSYVAYDGFRYKTQLRVAANTIVDLISRQSDELTDEFIENQNDMFSLLTSSRHSAAIRVSSVEHVSLSEGLNIKWSHGTRNLPSVNEISEFVEPIPPILPGDTEVVVEVFGEWSPLIRIPGLDNSVDISIQASAKPRFTREVKMEGVEPTFTSVDPEPTSAPYDYSAVPNTAPPAPPPLPGDTKKKKDKKTRRTRRRRTRRRRTRRKKKKDKKKKDKKKKDKTRRTRRRRTRRRRTRRRSENHFHRGDWKN